MTWPPVVLAVAGTDSGGAAGLAADLATLGHLGCHAACVVTAVTAQDTTGVRGIHAVPVETVVRQIEAVLDDLPVAAVKTGMLGSAPTVEVVANLLAHLPVVVDPVLVATSGAALADRAVIKAYRQHLLPRARVATPNVGEARVLAGIEGSARDLAAALADLGCPILLTGGPEWEVGAGTRTCTDWLCEPGGRPAALDHPAVPTTADHGTGCTFASAVAAGLAHGRPLERAARDAAGFVAARLAESADWHLGRGRGPVSHLVPPSRAPSNHPPAPPPSEEPA